MNELNLLPCAFVGIFTNKLPFELLVKTPTKAQKAIVQFSSLCLKTVFFSTFVGIFTNKLPSELLVKTPTKAQTV